MISGFLGRILNKGALALISLQLEQENCGIERRHFSDTLALICVQLAQENWGIERRHYSDTLALIYVQL